MKERDTKYFENYVRWSVATSPHINVSSVLEILLVARHSYSLHTGLHPYSHVRPTSSQPFESVAGMHVETSETTPRTCFPLAFRRFFISSTVNLSVPLSFWRFSHRELVLSTFGHILSIFLQIFLLLIMELIMEIKQLIMEFYLIE